MTPLLLREWVSFDPVPFSISAPFTLLMFAGLVSCFELLRAAANALVALIVLAMLVAVCVASIFGLVLLIPGLGIFGIVYLIRFERTPAYTLFWCAATGLSLLLILHEPYREAVVSMACGFGLTGCLCSFLLLRVRPAMPCWRALLHATVCWASLIVMLCVCIDWFVKDNEALTIYLPAVLTGALASWWIEKRLWPRMQNAAPKPDRADS